MVRCWDMPNSSFAASTTSGHRYVMLTMLGAVCLLAACRSTPAAAPVKPVSPDTWAVVDGREISRDDVDKAYRRTQEASQAPSDEEMLTAKLGLLNDMILQDILLSKAAALKLEVSTTELDAA